MNGELLFYSSYTKSTVYNYITETLEVRLINIFMVILGVITNNFLKISINNKPIEEVKWNNKKHKINLKAEEKNKNRWNR